MLSMPHLCCPARSTQKAPLPCSYALAIGPNEGKEGSKAFWSEPLQKGDEKAAEPRPACGSTPLCKHSNPTGSFGGEQGTGRVPGEALAFGADVTQGGWRQAKGPAMLWAQLTLLRYSS